MTLRLLQHRAPDGTRAVIAADTEKAWFVPQTTCIRSLAERAIDANTTLSVLATAGRNGGAVDLAAEYAAGRLIVPIDHDHPARLTMAGTGLTHLGSAEGRDEMHRDPAAAQTDSMRMFLEGVAGGRPASGETGQQPEWFYKGDGSQLRGPGETLEMPSFAQDGGEEPELAGIYLIGPDGTPFRLGICLANEFSDHVTERHNYLWLAHSKLRQAALGAELLIGETPTHVEGMSRIRRAGRIEWERPFLSGEGNMSHTLANLEHHHFKYAQFRRAGDIHVHFFGTATLSFSDGFRTREGDIFEITAAPFTLPLCNPLARAPRAAVSVRTL